MADDYDDPAFSGGNMDRPALKRLLADIEVGKVDIVVVYKIDRLTRSLTDFSRMIDVFERHGVSFVSVTVAVTRLDAMWEQLFPAEQQRIVRLLIDKGCSAQPP